jgi:hypothetical protein
MSKENITYAMKREILAYSLTYSKGLIEDGSCIAIAEAFDKGDVTAADIEEAVEELKDWALSRL